MTVRNELRKAIKSELKHKTLYQIAKGSGVNWSALNRFLTEERPNLQLGTVDRLCEYLGLTLTTKRKRGGRE